jgi:beta-glucanase (GH16 family)
VREYSVVPRRVGRSARKRIGGAVRPLAGLLLLIALLTGAAGSWQPVEAAPVAAVFTTTFTRPDQGNWTGNWLGGASQVTHPPNPSYELEAFDPARVAYTTAGLRLSIRNDPVTIGGTTYRYRSGAITGYQKQGYTYGRFSARIYIPCSDGTIVNWPAFWLVGDPYKWPATGEIDVLEGLGGHAWWHFHYRDAAGQPASYGGHAPGSYCGWHTYAVDWQPAAIKWYYDGALVGTVTSHITSAPMFPVFSYSLTDPDSARCTQYPGACGGPIDTTAVMRVSDFTVTR